MKNSGCMLAPVNCNNDRSVTQMKLSWKDYFVW